VVSFSLLPGMLIGQLSTNEISAALTEYVAVESYLADEGRFVCLV